MGKDTVLCCMQEDVFAIHGHYDMNSKSREKERMKASTRNAILSLAREMLFSL